MSAATGLFTAASLISSAPAMADDGLRVTGRDEVLPPNSSWFTGVDIAGETTARGQLVLAYATRPLDGTGEDAGWPSSFSMSFHECQEIPGYQAVFTCKLGAYYQRPPQFFVSADAADMTTAYRGYAYVPPGGDLAEGIDAARNSGVRPATATSGISQAVVRTHESAQRNTVAFDLPNTPAGKTVQQRLHVHAIDAGRLYLYFRPADGQVEWRREDIRIGNVTTGPGASCTVNWPKLADGVLNLICQLEPGDHTIGYELTPASGVRAWRMQAATMYDIYTSPGRDDRYVRQAGTFSTEGAPVFPRHHLLARDTSGQLFLYHGKGTAGTPFSPRTLVGDGWQTYNKLTRLSPLAEDLYLSQATAGATRGRGELVARDSAGYLWYYDRQFVYGKPYTTRVKVGGGWNVYNQLTGAGDVDRDGRMDLLARDASGALWLYKGTSSSTGSARFASRIKVGGGWQIYNQVTAGADLNDDGRPDLLARDASGVLWLYRGTGSSTAPYASRVKVGTGWQVYNQLSLTGDLTDDGKADAIARDASGVLWLYKGTGSTTAPFATRTKIGGGWNVYNAVL
ncbi:FG-GAP repeat domain-containing protein [Streptomyces sp. NPDC015127]|uniref:FG-GAP repeat domain-containing protein n=1 Tax=Streptomyces sp. NPDC015127 TaxID=3364939 RepID=UPI003700ECFB